TTVGFSADAGTLSAPSATTTAGKATVDFTSPVSALVTLAASLDSQTAPFTLGVDTPPTISTVASQTTNEDTPTGAIAFTIGDADGNPLTVSASSSNTGL